MILTDTRILEEIEKGRIVIDPFDRSALGSNSYDVHLGPKLAYYIDEELDCKKHNEVEIVDIPEGGYVILPTKIYLGVTEEYTETHDFIPFLEGKLSVGRLGISIHETAGKGDIGFCNTWTLEISVKQPVRIYAGMPIGQLIYFEASGQVQVPYNRKKSAKYTGRTDLPVELMMFKNFKSA